MFKIIKKIISALGYKLIEKRLYKNSQILEQFNAINTREVLSNLYKNNLINKLVQIGANDGVRFDVLRSFLIEFNTKALLVEPIPEYFEKLKNNYNGKKNIVFENSAISKNNEYKIMYKVDEKFYEFYSEHIYGLSSFKKSHLIKHGVRNNHIIASKINTINIEDLLNKHNFLDLDLLYVDAEGYDGEIILEFMKKINTKPIIIFEYIHTDHIIFEEVIKLLDQKNYKIIKCNENIIAMNKEIQVDL
tara:strand:- start:1216 stop:1956 length:741 start_codon:yes stop_codon:yes gene_type:complete